MKRIIAILCSTLFAIFNNLSPVEVPDATFIEDAYYEVEREGEPDWRSLYGTYFNVNSSADEECDSTPFEPKRSADLAVVHNSSGKSRYWIQPAVALPETYVATDGEELIAPMSCVVDTSPLSLDSSDGNLRLIVDAPEGKYALVFKSLKCWYCCARRKEYGPHSGNYLKKGDVIPQGMVVGIASDQTTFTIYKIDGSWETEVTYSDFFM